VASTLGCVSQVVPHQDEQHRARRPVRANPLSALSRRRVQ
jgi:hypothetical protein